MGIAIEEVVKVVAPIALEALAKAATKLLDDTNIQSSGYSTPIGQYPEQDGEIIKTDTTAYINNKFADNYRYFYKGLGSSPPDVKYPIVGATEDIMVWNPSKNEMSDIEGYIKKVLEDTLPDSDVIEVAENMADLFQARFQEVDLSWTPFNKRYNLKESGTIVDLQMVTAAGKSTEEKPLGIASYCFVAYKTK